MVQKDLRNNISFRAGTPPLNLITCQEVQLINDKINLSEKVDESEIAKAIEHTRTCKACRVKF